MIFKIGYKVVGEFENGVFRKSVIFSKHHLHNYHAWAIDSDIIDKLTTEGCKEIVIWERNERKEYKITFEDFKKHAFTINHGYGNQEACADIYWNRQEKLQNQGSLL